MPIDIERLRNLWLFAELDHHDLSQVARWVREVHADPGEALLEQDAMPSELFVIESGDVEVIRDGGRIATLGPGDPVGEMSLLRRQRRNATVRAISEVSAVAIPAGDVEEMGEEMPEILGDLRALMEARLREADDYSK